MTGSPLYLDDCPNLELDPAFVGSDNDPNIGLLQKVMGSAVHQADPNMIRLALLKSFEYQQLYLDSDIPKTRPKLALGHLATIGAVIGQAWDYLEIEDKGVPHAHGLLDWTDLTPEDLMSIASAADVNPTQLRTAHRTALTKAKEENKGLRFHSHTTQRPYTEAVSVLGLAVTRTEVPLYDELKKRINPDQASRQT